MHTDNLNFIDTGSGNTAIVFLHYFGGSSDTWLKVIEKLKDNYRCIAIDLWGFGKSKAPLGFNSVNNNATAIAGLIKKLQLNKFILIGHSMGAKIALAVASRSPSGLEKIILVAPSPPTPEPMDEKEQSQLLSAYNNIPELKKIINNITRTKLDDLTINDLVLDNLRACHMAWGFWIRYGSQENISSQMENIKAPVLVISGQYDKKLSTSYLHTEFIKYFRLATFHEAKDTAHLIPVEDPVTLVKLIREFISKNI